jgi:hypothetical protein
MLSLYYFNRLLLSIALLSLSMIAYQLSLMQYLSIVQWYHFAYMVIGIALLGFGAAGTFIALFRESLLRRSDFLLPLFMVLTGMFMPLILWLSGPPFARFDTYLLFVDRSQLWQLLLYELLFFIPFFFCALLPTSRDYLFGVVNNLSLASCYRCSTSIRVFPVQQSGRTTRRSIY